MFVKRSLLGLVILGVCTSVQAENRRCAKNDCLVIEDSAVYCSIDPYVLKGGSAFASKSRLQLRSGTYPLKDRKSLSGLSIRIHTRMGHANLEPVKGGRVSINRMDPDEENGGEVIELLEVNTPYSGNALSLDRFFLRTPRQPHDSFILGDPKSIRNFFEADRYLYVQVARESPLFPGLSDNTIAFAPCEMRDLPDEYFVFTFTDGSTIRLVVRVINGSNQLGYYIGRLLSASGSYADMGFDVRDHYRLAFIGSTRSWAELAIPTLVLQFADRGKVCGVIFDATQWDTSRAVNGYIAYEMTCDERMGVPIGLQSVVYPKRYVLP